MNNDIKIHNLRKKIQNLENQNTKLRERIKSLEAEIENLKPANPRGV